MSKAKAVEIGKSQVDQSVKDEMVQLDLLGYISDKIVPAMPVKKVNGKLAKRKRSLIPHSSVTKYFGLVDFSKTFATYCVGKANRLAAVSVKQFLKNEKSDFNLIYIVAMSGLGKSHLLHAAANELIEMSKTFCLVSGDLLSMKLKDIDALLSYEYLLIDDVDETSKDESTQKALSRLLEYAKMGEIKIVVTGGSLPKNLNGHQDKLRARLSSGLIHKIGRLDRAHAHEIVREKCSKIKFKISEEAMALVADSFDFHVYGLESAIHKLKSHYEVYGQEITVEVALEELKSLGRILDRNDNCQKIAGRVACEFGIKKEDIFSPSRKQEVVYARHIAMYILKEKNGLNIMKIAELFNRDHSSVIYGVTRIREEVKLRPELLKRIHKLI